MTSLTTRSLPRLPVVPQSLPFSPAFFPLAAPTMLYAVAFARTQQQLQQQQLEASRAYWRAVALSN